MTDASELDAESLFLGTDAGNATYRDAVSEAADAVVEAFAEADDPYSGTGPDRIEEWLADRDLFPGDGNGLGDTIAEVADGILADSIGVSHPRCVAHLHCPPMVPGLVAEIMLAAANQSMDSWDQSAAATHVEEALIGELCDLFGYGPGGDGVFTSGGTQSNFMGLLLARDRFARDRFGRCVRESGLPLKAKSMRILCSEAAHFTAKQAAAHLGLGENAVVTVPTDDEYRMDPDALEATIADLRSLDRLPFAVVGTAGTTDFGSIDPLDALADCADEHDLWFHVDAAYGGALAVCEGHRDKLDGIERADSLAVDFHKLFYQPISCGAFLLGDGDHYELLDRSVAYLNPEGEEWPPAPDLVSKSVQTTRRFDALKPYVTFRALGKEGLAELVEYTLDLADAAAELLAGAPDFEVLHDPTLNVLTFRYRPDETASDDQVDRLNAAVRSALLQNGDAVVGRTEVDGVTCLKFTLLDPRTTVEDVATILDDVRHRARTIEAVEAYLGR